MILPDADRPGRAHAQKVAKAIHGVAASVRILDLYPERHDGSDVSDFIANDTAGVRLAKEAKEAPLWGPSGPTTSAGVAADGAELLADVHAFLGRFVAYPSDHAHVAHTLWIAHAHAMEAWDSTPRIAFLSPEPGSGKTRALEVSEILVPNPVEAVNVTPAYLFRKVGAEEGAPTILYDEIDTVFGPKAKDNEEIRGLLNAGHRRGAVAGRCVVRGKIVETEEIPAYCAVALAGLGWLPDTLMSRSIVIRMRRRAPTETIEPYRRRDEIDEGHELRGRLAGWAAAKGKILYAARPAMPAGIEDRNADVWEALFAIADAAGGDWPKLAREAAVALIAAGREEEPSLGIRLLADLRTVTSLFAPERDRRGALHQDDPGRAACPGGSALEGSQRQGTGLARPGAPAPPVRHQIEANPGGRSDQQKGLRAGGPGGRLGALSPASRRKRNMRNKPKQPSNFKGLGCSPMFPMSPEMFRIAPEWFAQWRAKKPNEINECFGCFGCFASSGSGEADFRRSQRRSGLTLRPSWRQRSLLQRRADGPAAPRMRGAVSALR